MSQNTSSAVMQQRREPHDSLDDFPTPPWGTRALLEQLVAMDLIKPGMSCREPAANRGHMVRPLREAFAHVDASDIFDYGAGFPVRDYLFGPPPEPVDWTITNPPFRLAEQFIERGLETSRHGVAVIVRAAFLEGIGRYNSLFRFNPPAHVFQFTERVVMHKGKLSKDGSTATAYAWLVWHKEAPVPVMPRLHWTGVCRARLEKPGDYQAV